MSSKNRKLLVLASTYPRWYGDPEPGFVHELSRRLTGVFDVYVLCPHAPGALVDEVLDEVRIHRFRYAPGALESLVHGGGILANLKRSPWKWCLVPLFFFALAFTCVKFILIIRPFCVHAHWIFPQGLVVALTKHLCGGDLFRFVLTSHGGDLFALQGRLFGALKRWVIGKTDAMTVVSYPMLDQVRGFGACAAKASVMPMGVDFLDRFKINPDVKRVEGEILFVGRLVEKKGVKYLIQAIPLIRQRIPATRLVVIGSGPEEQALAALVASLGLTDCVEFRGSLPQEALPALYSRASVFVAPFVDATSGDKEGLGLVSIEAIACGCPVVVSDVPVVADIFLDTEMDMRAVPADSTSLAQKVGDMLLSPDAARRRVLDVRQRLIKKYGWDTVAKRYAELLTGGK